MNKFSIITGILLSSHVSFSQNNITSLIKLIDNKITLKSEHTSILPDSLQADDCQKTIYFDSTGLHKLVIECGDASLEMLEQHFYFKNNDLIYMISKRHYFNAPRTFTKEVAKQNGETSGWYDPAKTKTVKYECFFEHGKMKKLIDDKGKEVLPTTDLFKKTETIVMEDAKKGVACYYKVK